MNWTDRLTLLIDRFAGNSFMYDVTSTEWNGSCSLTLLPLKLNKRLVVLCFHMLRILSHRHTIGLFEVVNLEGWPVWRMRYNYLFTAASILTTSTRCAASGKFVYSGWRRCDADRTIVLTADKPAKKIHQPFAHARSLSESQMITSPNPAELKAVQLPSTALGCRKLQECQCRHSERVSNCLMAHQHKVGYLVPL